MFKELFSKFKKPKQKRIAFLDGDQNLQDLITTHQQYLVGIETHLVRAMTDSCEPRALRKTVGINKIYLEGYRAGKEVVDKFIGAYIQKSIQSGYTEITVVSSDFDFIDIFKMAIQLNPDAKQVSFRIIVPNPANSKCTVTSKFEQAQIANIEVVLA